MLHVSLVFYLLNYPNEEVLEHDITYTHRHVQVYMQ